MIDWILSLFGIARVVEYLFRCIVCGLEAVLSQAEAKQMGWRYQHGEQKGWRCSRCAR